MSKLYYETFPVAPVAVISAISGIAGIPSIVDARARGGSGLLLEILVNDDFQLTEERMDALQDVLECPAALLHIEASDRPDTVLVLADRTCYDLRGLFEVKAPFFDPHPDSEENVMASGAIINGRARLA